MVYMQPVNDHDFIDRAFTHQPLADEWSAAAQEAVRDACKFAAHELVNVCTRSPELTLALRKLQEAMMYANSSITQHGVNAR